MPLRPGVGAGRSPRQLGPSGQRPAHLDRSRGLVGDERRCQEAAVDLGEEHGQRGPPGVVV
jgi:hypothetical protein